MTWLVMGLAGTGLGVAFFGGLGLSLHLAFRRPRLVPILIAGGFARFTLLGCALMLLARGHTDWIVAAFGGIVIGRGLCLAWVRGHGLGL